MKCERSELPKQPCQLQRTLASMLREKTRQHFLPFDFDSARADARKDLYFNCAIGEEFDFPSLAWHHYFYGDCFRAKVGKRVVQVCRIQAYEKVEELLESVHRCTR